MKPLVLRKVRLIAAYPGAIVRRPTAAFRYLLHGREYTNLTYEIENVDELVDFLARKLDRAHDEIAGYVGEPESDAGFLGELSQALASRPDRNPAPHFGRRLGWYAIVRALRPDVVVETGVHDGLGSALLLQALERNGHGRLLGFDIDPASGWLVPHNLRDRYALVLGDLRETLPHTLAGHRVGVFVHDSLHTYEHERFELELALGSAADRIALVSDNAHATTALADVCREHGLDYGLFRERPRDHFYPGAGLGLGLSRGPHQ
jgi:hypothetical protein